MAKRLDVLIENPLTRNKIEFQINPEQIDYPTTVAYTTQNILGFGEVQAAGQRMLRRITMNNILPVGSERIIETLELWVEQGIVVRLIVSDEINMLCRINSFTREIREATPIQGCTIQLIELRVPFGRI